jgi:hypothetical protein
LEDAKVRRSISWSLVALAIGLLGCFDLQNDAKDFEEVKPPIVFGEGFYGFEKHKDSAWRWMGDDLPKEGPVPLKGLVHLLNSKKDTDLTIAGVAVQGPVSPGVKLFFNGELLSEFTAPKDRFEKTFKVPAAKQGRGEYSELLITVDKFSIPSENNKNSQDTRRLAIRFTKLTWGAHGGIVRVVEPPKPAVEPPMPAVEPPVPAAPVADVRPDASPPYRWLTLLLLIAVVLFAPVLAFSVYLALRARKSSSDALEESAPTQIKCPHCGHTIKVCGANSSSPTTSA